MPVCSPHHPLAAAQRVSPRRLAGERWLAFPPRGDGADPYSLAIGRELITKGVAVGEIIPIDSLTAQKRMVEAGFGLALVPESAIKEEQRAGTLCVMAVPMAATIPVVLIHRRHGYLSGAAQGLREALLTVDAGTPARVGKTSR